MPNRILPAAFFGWLDSFRTSRGLTWGDFHKKYGLAKTTAHRWRKGKNFRGRELGTFFSRLQEVDKLLPEDVPGLPSDLVNIIRSNMRQSQDKQSKPKDVPGESIVAFVDREETYRAIVEVIDRIAATHGAHRHICLAALHFADYDLNTGQPENSDALRAFDERTKECSNSKGRDHWHVRELYFIRNRARFHEIEGWLRADGDAYEVKVFVFDQQLPLLKLMLIGDHDAFIGVDDLKYHRVRCGIHVHGPKSIEVLTQYWNSLWNDVRAITLRIATGIYKPGLEKVRQEIARLEAGQQPY